MKSKIWKILVILVCILEFVTANVSKEEEERLKKELNISSLPEHYEVVYPKHQERIGDGPLLPPRIYPVRSKSHLKNKTKPAYDSSYRER